MEWLELLCYRRRAVFVPYWYLKWTQFQLTIINIQRSQMTFNLKQGQNYFKIKLLKLFSINKVNISQNHLNKKKVDESIQLVRQT